MTNKLSKFKLDNTEYLFEDLESRELIESLYSNMIKDTASGNPAIFNDGANLPVKSLTAQIEPKQDLNGYDYPWVGGAGKNLLPMTLDNLKSINTAGTWNGNTYVLSGITYTVNVDGGGNVMSINTNGTALAYSLFRLVNSYTASKQMWLNGAPTSSSLAGWGIQAEGDSTRQDIGDGVSLTSGYNATRIIIVVPQGASPSNVEFKPMLRPYTEASIPFEPYSNICPISGYDSVEVTRTGVNVWDEEWEVGGINDTTGINSVSPNQLRSKNYVHVFPNTSYYFYIGKGTALRVFFYDADKNFLNYIDTGSTTATIPSNAHYLRFRTSQAYGTTYLNDISINYPSTDHDYHPAQFQSITIPLGDTVYGGTLNVTTGELVVDRAEKKLIGAYNEWWSLQSINDYGIANFQISNVLPGLVIGKINPFINNMLPKQTSLISNTRTEGIYINDRGVFFLRINSERANTVEALKTWLSNNNLQLVYELAKPQTIQLTASQLSTILGTNVISADSGAVTVEYYADMKLYIDSKLN